MRLGCPCTKEDWTCVIVVPSWVVIRGWWVVDQRWAQKHWHTVPQHVWGLIHMLFGDTFSVNSGAGIKDNIVKWRLSTLLLISILLGSHFTEAKRFPNYQIGLSSNLIDSCSSGSLGRWKPSRRDKGWRRHYCHTTYSVQDRACMATAHFVTIYPLFMPNSLGQKSIFYF